MAESGWVSKRQDKKDRRMLRLFPTGKANNMRGKLKTEREEANEELLSGFSSDERVLLKRLLLSLL